MYVALYFFLGPAVALHFFNSRIATAAIQWCTEFGIWSAILLHYRNILDWISFPFQPDLDYTNETNCGHAKKA